MDLKLRGKNALVTGGSVGLGRAICRVLAAEGAAVAVNYRNHAAEAESLAKELTAAHGVRAVALGADVAEEGEVAAMFQAAAERVGPLDVLVNGTLIAHGEVVVINDKFGIRMTDVISPSERIKKLG